MFKVRDDLGFNFSYRVENGVRVTECCIFEINGDILDPVGCGMALCSLKDHYNKAIGRKLALARAIHSYNPIKDLELRESIWSVFFANCKIAV